MALDIRIYLDVTGRARSIVAAIDGAGFGGRLNPTSHALRDFNIAREFTRATPFECS